MGRSNTHHTRRWATAGACLLLVPWLVACAGSADEDDAAAAEATTEAAEDLGGELQSTATVAGDVPTGGATDTATIDYGAVGRDVIVEMHVVMSSDDVARSVSSITADAAALGGGIASSDVDYATTDQPENATGHAVLVVKVPPESVNRLLDGLADTGDVLSINQSAQDVTDQLVDLDVRISNARTSVANVREFMDSTTNLTELVALEGELTRRQTELEQLEAQQRNLTERVELATITIEVVAAADAPASEPDEGIADALASGWEAFVTVLFGIAYVLAVMAPFLVIGLVALGIAWFVIRRRPDRRHPNARTESTDEPDREHASPVG